MQDGPEASGCELDFEAEPDDEETAGLRALFPDGDPSTKAQWEALFPQEASEAEATSER